MLEPVEMAVIAARAADEKKAKEIRVLDMRNAPLGVTDYFVIASGDSDRQVRRVVDSVEEKLREYGLKPAWRSGEPVGHWVLVDYVDIVVHVFLSETRAFYDLERLWKDVPVVDWRTESVDGPGSGPG